jgi:hypothetical protein
MKTKSSTHVIGRAISSADPSATSSMILMVVENKDYTFKLSSIEGLSNIATSSESFVRATTTMYQVVTNTLEHGVSVVNEYFSLTTKAVAGYFDKLFAKEIYTDKVCIKKSNGVDVCLTGDQVESVLNATQIPLLTPAVNNNQGGGASVVVPDGSSGTSSTTNAGVISTSTDTGVGSSTPITPVPVVVPPVDTSTVAPVVPDTTPVSVPVPVPAPVVDASLPVPAPVTP